MLALLDVLGHERVDVLGVSWGGGLAQQFAWTARRALPQARAGRDRHRHADGARPSPRPRADGHPAPLHRPRLPAAASRRDIYGGSARHDPESPARLLHTHSRGPGRAAATHYQLLAAAGWTSIPFLPLLRQPTLVLTGDDDPIIPTVNGRLLAALIRRTPGCTSTAAATSNSSPDPNASPR